MLDTPSPSLSRRSVLTGMAGMGSAALLGCASAPPRKLNASSESVLRLSAGSLPHSTEKEATTRHSATAAATLAYLTANLGQNTLIGVQENNSNRSQNPTFGGTEEIVMARTGGRRPAIRGFDIRMASGTEQTNDCIPVAKAAYEKHGQIPTFSYHMGVPHHDLGPSHTVDSFRNSQHKGFDINNLQYPGSPGHDLFWSKIDTIGARLSPLAEAGVPVLFRPFHETISSNFWWGSYFDSSSSRWLNSGDDYVRLWRSVHDRLVGGHGLTNLLWVWCVESQFRMYYLNHSSYNRPPEFSYEEWYPGDEYVDITGSDLYTSGWTNSAYPNPTTTGTSTVRADLYQADSAALAAVASSKPAALCECDWPASGTDLRSSSARIAYEVFWHEGNWPSISVKGGRDAWYAHIASVLSDEHTITSDELPVL